MRGVDRTIIGSERRRWHPVNPFQMRRHGDKSESFPPGAAFSSANHGIG
jgi:hypothetical protein